MLSKQLQIVIVVFFCCFTLKVQANHRKFDFLANRVIMEENDRNIPTFTFQLCGGATNKEYVLITKNLTGREDVIHSSLKVANDGTLIERQGSHFMLSTLAIGPGEPLEVIILSKDQKEQCQKTIIPRPLTKRDKNYTLSLRLADQKCKTFSLFASGFRPYETVTLTTSSENSMTQKPLQVSSKGQIFATISYTSLPQTGGVTDLIITGVKGSVAIGCPWGSEYQKNVRQIRRFEKKLLCQK